MSMKNAFFKGEIVFWMSPTFWQTVDSLKMPNTGQKIHACGKAWTCHKPSPSCLLCHQLCQAELTDCKRNIMKASIAVCWLCSMYQWNSWCTDNKKSPRLPLGTLKRLLHQFNRWPNRNLKHGQKLLIMHFLSQVGAGCNSYTLTYQLAEGTKHNHRNKGRKVKVKLKT